MFPRSQLAKRLARISQERTAVAIPPRPAGERPRVRPLDELAPGAEEWRFGDEVCWERTVNLTESAADLHERLLPALAVPPKIGIRSAPDAWTGDRLLVVDIETCGFASQPAFMVGALEVTEDVLLLRQAVARDYAEEATLMRWTVDLFTGAGGVVTFNGRSFDVRYLRERIAYHRLPALEEPPHLDLLHVARRLWGGDLPNCRLQTLETALFGRKRRGDIPGAAIPYVYHSFVDTGDAREIAIVLEHNRLDIITLAELFAEAWQFTMNPDPPEESTNGTEND